MALHFGHLLSILEQATQTQACLQGSKPHWEGLPCTQHKAYPLPAKALLPWFPLLQSSLYLVPLLGLAASGYLLVVKSLADSVKAALLDQRCFERLSAGWHPSPPSAGSRSKDRKLSHSSSIGRTLGKALATVHCSTGSGEGELSMEKLVRLVLASKANNSLRGFLF